MFTIPELRARFLVEKRSFTPSARRTILSYYFRASEISYDTLSHIHETECCLFINLVYLFQYRGKTYAHALREKNMKHRCSIQTAGKVDLRNLAKT
jgi:hypothetical protein